MSGHEEANTVAYTHAGGPCRLADIGMLDRSAVAAVWRDDCKDLLLADFRANIARRFQSSRTTARQKAVLQPKRLHI